jgi:beta-ribofuranosylaminobenzene 5'-phosphate synthase
MSDSILITTGARLHFGFFAHGGACARPAGAPNYGGIGLMIDSPGFVLEAAESRPHAAESNSVVECWTEFVECTLNNAGQVAGRDSLRTAVEEQELLKRIAGFISMYGEHRPRGRRLHGRSVDLRAAIPLHRGLGAGTQLGMAVARALSFLAGETDVDAVTLAKRVGRGARSAIGIHGFERGGFLVDAGKHRDDEIGVLESRTEIPAGWRFVLISPPGESPGLSGPVEAAALSRLPAMSITMTEHLRRLVAAEMLPALKVDDCERFGEALYRFGRTVGEYFRPIQGGTYATPLSGDLVTWIRAQGFPGIAQSSWGPTLAVCCPEQKIAELLAAKIATEPRCQDCRTRIACPLNTGAKIELPGGRGGLAQ